MAERGGGVVPRSWPASDSCPKSLAFERYYSLVFVFDTRAVLTACEELDRWRAALDSKGPLPRAWEGRLRRDLEAEAIAASTGMEGVPVTVDEVRRILAGDRPTAVSPLDQALVEGYRDAMGFVLRRADDPEFRWEPELLVGLHDRILGGRYALGAGRLRVGQRYLVNSATGTQVFLPPPPTDVPGHVAEICRQMGQNEDHPAIRSAWIHVAVAAVHPFDDGNGRAARVLASLAMYRGGFRRREFTSLEEWWGRHRAAYYESFACLGTTFDPSADVTPFIRSHVAAQLSQVRALDLRERVERRIWTAITNVIGEAGLEPRVANAVWDAFFDRDVTAGYYRSLTDVSAATATNDLTTAVAARLMEAEGERRGRRYRAGRDLYERVADEVGIGMTVHKVPPWVARDVIVGELTSRVAGSSD